MILHLKNVISIHQTHEDVMTAASLIAKLLERVILGLTIREAVSWAIAASTLTKDLISEEECRLLQNLVSSCQQMSSQPYVAAVRNYGLSAHLDDGFLHSVFYGLLHCFTEYEHAIKTNILVGGDSVARAWLLGMFFAAEGRLNPSVTTDIFGHSIPMEWKMNTPGYRDAFLTANRIAGSNPYFQRMREKSWCSIRGVTTSS